MQKPRSTKALLIPIGLLGLIMAMLLIPDLRERNPEYDQGLQRYEVQLTVRGHLEGDHVMVQDTLNYYAEAAYADPAGNQFSEMKYCCEGTADMDYFQWAGSFAFDSWDASDLFLSELLHAEELEFHRLSIEEGKLTGLADAQFVVPGTEFSIELEGLQFNLRKNYLF